MAGSIRQRGRNTWELRVYVGVDPETTKERWASTKSASTPTTTVLADHKTRRVASGDSFVFSHATDGTTTWKPNWVTKEFIRLRRDVGIPHCRLDDLRHLTATEMARRRRRDPHCGRPPVTRSSLHHTQCVRACDPRRPPGPAAETLAELLR